MYLTTGPTMAPFTQVSPDYGDRCDLNTEQGDPCHDDTNTRCVDIQGEGHCVCQGGFARKDTTELCQS